MEWIGLDFNLCRKVGGTIRNALEIAEERQRDATEREIIVGICGQLRSYYRVVYGRKEYR